jgi:hypothetical protein
MTTVATSSVIRLSQLTYGLTSKYTTAFVYFHSIMASISSFDDASSSAAGGASTTVPDDLQLNFNRHFHW